MIGGDPKEWLIDTSTPEALERDFYAWLKGELSTPTTPTSTHSSNVHCPLPSIDELAIGSVQKSPSVSSLLLPPPLLNLSRDSAELLSDGFSPAPSTVSSSTAASIVTDGNQNQSMTFFSFPTAVLESYNDYGMLEGSYNQQRIDPSNNLLSTTSPLLVPKKEPTNGEVKTKSTKRSSAPRKLLNRNVSARNSGENELVEFEYGDGSLNILRVACRTNQLGRTYNPGLPLSLNERQHIVNLFTSGWKICDISKSMQITHSCVSKILNRFRATGSVKPKDAKESRLESPLVQTIRSYQARYGCSRQSEIRDLLIRNKVCTPDTAPSRSSINHILRTKLDIRVKGQRAK
ncbi:Paired box protein Pax-2-B [Aphelenchoides besseyi]|nr:Paired box protein Pax-2-B [Aphelenchoides besseyi]